MEHRFGHSVAAAFAAGLAVSLSAGVVSAQAQVPPPPVPPPPGTEWVWVTLPSLDRNAAIEAFEGVKTADAGDDDAWRRVCTEPCGIWIPSGTRLRVNGDFRASAPLALPARPGGAHLAVEPVRSGLRVTGIVLMPVGGSFAFVGGALYLTASAVDGTSSSRASRDIRALSGGIALFGLATLGTGLALFLTNQKTLVDLRSPGADGPLATQAARLRVPIGKNLWLSPEGIHF